MYAKIKVRIFIERIKKSQIVLPNARLVTIQEIN